MQMITSVATLVEDVPCDLSLPEKGCMLPRRRPPQCTPRVDPPEADFCATLGDHPSNKMQMPALNGLFDRGPDLWKGWTGCVDAHSLILDQKAYPLEVASPAGERQQRTKHALFAWNLWKTDAHARRRRRELRERRERGHVGHLLGKGRQGVL